MYDRKAVPQFTKAIDDRTVIGIFAVHGNVDSGGDRSWPGTFAEYAVDGRKRTRFLWQHDSAAPPIATVNYIREVSRAELPTSVLSYAPDATGGVEISRSYLETPRGNEVLTGIKAGAIEEMSYGYDAKQYDFEETEHALIRNIRKVELYDVSDVNWGMNPATTGVKQQPIDHQNAVVQAAIVDYVQRLKDLSALRAKEGRVLSDANRKRIAQLQESLTSVLADLTALLTATEPRADPAKALAAFAEFQRLHTTYYGVLTCQA